MSTDRRPPQERQRKVPSDLKGGADGSSNNNKHGKDKDRSAEPPVVRERQHPRSRGENGGNAQQRRQQRDPFGKDAHSSPQGTRGSDVTNHRNTGANGGVRGERRDDAGKASVAVAAAPRPFIHCKKDIEAAPTWNKGGNGPSFADMVRQKAENRKPATGGQQQTVAQPDTAPTQVSKANDDHKEAEEKRHEEAKQQTPVPAQIAAAHVVIEEEEEEFIPAPVAAPVAVPVAAPIAAPVAAPVAAPAVASVTADIAAPAPSAYYVLEVDRMEHVKLPVNVIKSAGMSPGLYTFSGQAGKPPTPPVSSAPQQLQQTIYRSDVANLGGRAGAGVGAAQQAPSWGIVDGRAPQQQHPWHPTADLDYWSERSGPSALLSQQHQVQGRFQQYPAGQMQYSSYQNPQQQQQQMRTQNFYPARLRSDAGMLPQQQDAASAAGIRPVITSQLNRSATANGGGVW